MAEDTELQDSQKPDGGGEPKEPKESKEPEGGEEGDDVEISDGEIPTVDDYNKVVASNKKLHARLMKAKGYVQDPDSKQWVKKEPEAKPQPKIEALPNKEATPAYLTREEGEEMLIRSTKNYSDDAMKELKAIAKGKGISLAQAVSDPLFSLYLKNEEEETKAKKAQLPAARGSARLEKASTKPFTQMTQEEQFEHIDKKTAEIKNRK